MVWYRMLGEESEAEQRRAEEEAGDEVMRVNEREGDIKVDKSLCGGMPRLLRYESGKDGKQR